MNTTLYLGQVFTRSGDFLGNVAAFDIDNFNIVFISEYCNYYYCNAEYKTKISFPNMSEKEVFDIVSKHEILPMKSSVDNYKELLEETYKKYPEFTRYTDEDFEIKDKETFLKSINNKPSFSVHCVEVGVKHPVK
jgi:hypothetical protein